MEITTFANRYRLKIRLDEDGTKIVLGKVGHLFEYDDDTLGVLVMPNPPRVQYWGFAKTQLIAKGCTVVQDGTGEGCAIFDPGNPEQVRAAIKAASIKRKRPLSPEQRERLIERLRTPTGRAPVAVGTSRSPKVTPSIPSANFVTASGILARPKLREASSERIHKAV